MSPGVMFAETTARRGVESVPLSHLSIELGHLYAEDFGLGYDHLNRHFERVAPWVDRARESCKLMLPRGTKPRVSTAFLIDDYFHRFGDPGTVIGVVQDIARKHGLVIDYIAREAGCAYTDGVPLAKLVADRLVADPGPFTTGSRPPVTETGWLCNGQRSPVSGVAPAMKAAPAWAPPVENGSSQHSIFVDVQLWSEADGVRTWSCAFLASVWQLLRLGLLRHMGAAPVRPVRLGPDDDTPDDWDRLPGVLQVNDRAEPFSAYRTMSVLPSRFLSVELAVRTILSQVAVDGDVVDQVAARGAAEGADLPRELVNRIGYAFMSD